MCFEEACRLARQYFKDSIGVDELSTASEDDTNWYFNSSRDAIGCLIISINKTDAEISVVDLLLDDDFYRISKSKPLDLPACFLNL